jgi:hypothetical protein
MVVLGSTMVKIIVVEQSAGLSVKVPRCLIMSQPAQRGRVPAKVPPTVQQQRAEYGSLKPSVMMSAQFDGGTEAA